MVTSCSLKSKAILFVLDTAGSSLLELLGALAAGLVVLGAMLHSVSFFHREFSRYE
jgi:Tfp pilus assembly protein PilW